MKTKSDKEGRKIIKTSVVHSGLYICGAASFRCGAAGSRYGTVGSSCDAAGFMCGEADLSGAVRCLLHMTVVKRTLVGARQSSGVM